MWSVGGLREILGNGLGMEVSYVLTEEQHCLTHRPGDLASLEVFGESVDLDGEEAGNEG